MRALDFHRLIRPLELLGRAFCLSPPRQKAQGPAPDYSKRSYYFLKFSWSLHITESCARRSYDPAGDEVRGPAHQKRCDRSGQEFGMASSPDDRPGQSARCSPRSDSGWAATPVVLRLVVSLALLLVTAGGLIGWWIWSLSYVRTNNAYVVGNITPVSSQISGMVVALYTDDNMIVKAGDAIAQIDPVPGSSPSIRPWPTSASCGRRSGPPRSTCD